jgi:predicted NACHT family NTPase
MIPLFFACTVWIALCIFAGSYPTASVQAVTHLAVATPFSQGAPVSTGPSQDVVINAGAVILAALLAGIFGFLFIRYQISKTRELERENERLQTLLGNQLREQQFEDDFEKSRYEAWQSARQEERERERERRKSSQATTRTIMAQSRTATEREDACRQAIRADPNIAQLQILDMAHPMDVDKLYVRVSLHQKSRLNYEIDEALWKADIQGDPNQLLKVRASFLEARIKEAMTPEEALQRYSRCIVLGDPGAGKSTLLKYLTLRAIDHQLPKIPDLPIYCPW